MSGTGLTISQGLDFRPKTDRDEWDIMGTAQRPDPELLSVGRPRCLKCNVQMITADVSEGPEGFERRTFECLKCGDTDSKG